MSDFDIDHLPTLIIPPDHRLAEKLHDAELGSEAATGVIDEYRDEVGGHPLQKVGLTYAKRPGHPGLWAVVTSRPWPKGH